MLGSPEPGKVPASSSRPSTSRTTSCPADAAEWRHIRPQIAEVGDRGLTVRRLLAEKRRRAGR